MNKILEMVTDSQTEKDVVQVGLEILDLIQYAEILVPYQEKWQRLYRVFLFGVIFGNGISISAEQAVQIQDVWTSMMDIAYVAGRESVLH